MKQYEEIGQKITAWKVAEEGTAEDEAIASAVGAAVPGEGRLVLIDGQKVVVPFGEYITNRDGFIGRETAEAFQGKYREVQQ